MRPPERDELIVALIDLATPSDPAEEDVDDEIKRVQRQTVSSVVQVLEDRLGVDIRGQLRVEGELLFISERAEKAIKDGPVKLQPKKKRAKSRKKSTVRKKVGRSR